MIIDEYEKEIKRTIKYLENIPGYDFVSTNVYGTAVNDKLFKRGFSDIDLIFMSKDFDKINLHKIVKEIDNLKLDFKEKRPMLIDDNLCKRIEFYIKYPSIPVDITLAPGLIPSMEELETNAWYDNFEALIGGVYVNSKSIYGKIPDYDIFMKDFYPFYSDDLREKRMDILANRLSITNEHIEMLIKEKNLDASDILHKYKKHFIKFLYIYYRKYYISPDKHIYYQLSNFLNLSEEEKQTICLAKGNLFYASEAYIELVNDYLNRYKKEKVLKRNK